MKTHALEFPVFVEDLDREDDPSTSLAVSTLLPGVKARIDTFSGDSILLEASSLTASSLTAPSIAASFPFARTTRLVVLIPENELDENELARRVWRLAAPGALEVLFVAITPEPGSEAYLRLRLATLASLVRDERVQAGFSFTSGRNWVEAGGQVWRPGDLLVCLQGMRVPGFLQKGTDLPKQLSESLAAPVYSMGGLLLSPSLRQLRRRKDWIAWTAFLGTLGIFGWGQLLINRAMSGTWWTVFMMFSVLVEIAILWVINERIQ